MTGPTVVLSLDFELRWGVADRRELGSYRANLAGVREVVPRLVSLFERLGVRATWATVGALACEGWDEYFSRAPQLPRYENAALNLDLQAFRREDPTGRLFFAPDLVRRVAGSKGQDLGSHTFSHIYLREPGVTFADVEADAAAVRSLFVERFSVVPVSFVFPRNQVAHEAALRAQGIRVVRDTPSSWYWNAVTKAGESKAARALRLTDAFVPLASRAFDGRVGAHRASHFLRFGIPKAAHRVHCWRIVRDVRAMADTDVVHLWCHPHNLGRDPEGSVARLAGLLETIRLARPDVRFASMADAVGVSAVPQSGTSPASRRERTATG